MIQTSGLDNKLHSLLSKRGRRSAIPTLFRFEKRLQLARSATVVSHFFSLSPSVAISFNSSTLSSRSVWVALVVVYDYFPNSQTLYEAHLKPKAPQFQNGRLQSQNVRLIERTLWSYIIQLAGAIKAVHDAGLAVRVVDVTKILVTSKNRFVSPISLSTCHCTTSKMLRNNY